MKIARFEHENAPTYGIVDGDEIVLLQGDPLYAGFQPIDERVKLADVKLLAPVIPRSKIVAVGRNYADHAAEFGNDVPDEPMLFFKPNTSVIGPGDPIVLPAQSEHVDLEAELAIVIGAIAKHVPAADAHKVIFGYTCANDVSARDLQKNDGQWARAKGMDTFCPLGPVIETEFEPGERRIASRINGETKQNGRLSDLVHKVPEIIEFVSAAFTLLPGDVILTGTPAGVAQIHAGDTVEVDIEGIGTLANGVQDSPVGRANTGA